MSEIKENAVKTLGGALTPYDVLGYLLPGVALLASAAGFESWVESSAVPRGETLPIYPLSSAFARVFTLSPEPSWPLQVGVLLIVAGTAYIVGHIVASISALTVDRVYVAKAHGYPLPRFLGYNVKPEIEAQQRSYRAFAFLLACYLVSRSLSLPGAPSLEHILPRPLAQLSGQGVFSPYRLSNLANVSGYLMIALLGLRVLSWNFAHGGGGERPARPQSGPGGGARPLMWLRYVVVLAATWIFRASAAFLEILGRVFSEPHRAVTRLLGTYVHSKHQLEPLTVAAFKQSLAESLTVNVEELPFDTNAPYWYALLLVRKRSADAAGALDNWMRLYGFARNLSTAFLLAAVYLMLWLAQYGSSMQYGNEGARHVTYALPPVFLLASAAMLMRYYYLYTDYFTKYLIRSVVAAKRFQ